MTSLRAKRSNLCDGVRQPYALSPVGIHIRGASLVLAQSEVVVLEISVARRFEGEAGFVETISFLAGQGFRLCDIVGAADTAQGLLKQLDLAFLRVDGELAKKVYCD
jgi:hypothetical protein